MYKALLAATCLLGVTQARAADTQDARELTATPEEAVVDWCSTFEVWDARDVANNYAAPGGGCPIQGDCDIPGTRDDYLTSEETEFLVVRMHINVLRADDGSDPAATEAQVIERMAEMNRDYAPWRVRFVYTWEYHDSTLYRYGGSDNTMKNTYALEPDRRCNVYVRGNGQSAYGTFPWDPNATGNLGGIVCQGPFFAVEQHVMTHEMGHNLGLWHTHHGVSEVTQCGACYERADGQNADTTGDYVSETPATPINYTCDDPAGTDTCSNTPWGDTLPEDYMSYGFFDADPCWNRFVPQQGARMHCWTTAQLSGWLACLSDLDDSGDTGIEDLLALLAAWGPCDACNADIDGDGMVGFSDLLFVLETWGTCL